MADIQEGEDKIFVIILSVLLKNKNIDTDNNALLLFRYISVPVAQWLEHCVSSAKVVGSIPREHIC